MMGNSRLTLAKLLLFGFLILLLKTGQCVPKKNILATMQLNYTNDGPKNYLPIGKLNQSLKNHISIRRQLDDDHNDAPKNYTPTRMQHNSNDSVVPRKYNSVLRQQNESSNNSDRSASKKYIPVQMQHDVRNSAVPKENISFPTKQNESSKSVDLSVTKKHAHVKRHFDYSDSYDPRRHLPYRRQEVENSEAESPDAVDSGSSEVDSPSDKVDSGSSDTVDSGSSDTVDSESSETGDSGLETGDSDGDSSQQESITKKPVWPTNTWTEVMVLFRKDVRPENLKLNVGRDNIFKFIGKALERSRETELELLKLKELLKKLRHKIGGGGGGDHSDVNININAASPLGINADVGSRDRKNSMGGDFLRDVLHSNYARSPVMAQIGDTSLSFGKGMSDEMLEDEKRMFITKGAQFLRDAWLQYRMRRNHQLYERSDEHQNRTINSALNGEMLDSERREYIKKGITFLHEAWNQYKLKKYHHL